MVTMVLRIYEILKGKLIKYFEKDETELENKNVLNEGQHFILELKT